MISSMRLCGAVLLAVASLAARAQGAPPNPALLAGTKVAVIVVQNSTGENSNRVMAALSYARQFKEAGADVQLYFDSDGVLWPTLAHSPVQEPSRRAPAPTVQEGQKPRPTVDSSGKAIPIVPDAPPAPAPAEEKQTDPSLVKKVKKSLDELAQLGVQIKVSARAVDRLKLREKLRGKPVIFFNELNQQAAVPELVAQGYKIFLF